MKIFQNVFFGRALMVLVLAALLLWTPLWNGYPLLHADSGTYIWSSVIFLVPQDRPIGYSLFLRATQLFPSLWAVVIVQALGTAYLLWRVAERLLAAYKVVVWTRAWLAFGIVVATILLTTVSAFVGFILADILASWIFLATILFFVSTHRFDRVLAGLALVASIGAHNSHVVLAVGMALLVIGYALVTMPAERRKALLQWGAALLIGVASILAVDVYLRAGVGVTRGGNTILLNRFAESGVLQDTLGDYCASSAWTLCASADTIRTHTGEPRWFLFGADSPISQTGWDKKEDEQRDILARAVQCCWQKILVSSAQETWRQLWFLEIQGYVTPLSENMNAVLAIQKNFPRELETFRASHQQRNEFTPTRLVPLNEDTIQVIFLVVAFCLGVYSIVRRDATALLLLGSAVYFLVLNAVVVASVSGAATRYQGRVYWLLGYVVLVVGVRVVLARRQVANPF